MQHVNRITVPARAQSSAADQAEQAINDWINCFGSTPTAFFVCTKELIDELGRIFDNSQTAT
jgi:hypothetical protein